MSKKKQYSESLRVGVLLALTGGFLDAYTYISRGNVGERYLQMLKQVIWSCLELVF